MPRPILAYMEERGMTPEISIRSDLSKSGVFEDRWLVGTQKELLTLEPDGAEVSTYSYEQLSELKIENMVSSGILIGVGTGADELVCRFSNTRAKEFGHFVKVVNKLIGDEKLEDADREVEDFAPVCPTCGLRYPDAKRKVCPKCLDKRSLFIRLLGYLPRYKYAIIIILLCIVASSILRLFAPFLGGRILFDEVLHADGKYHGHIVEVVLLMLGSSLLSILFDIMYGRVNAKLTAKVFYDLKTDIYTNMQRLSYGFFTKKQTGGLMTRINWDALQHQYLFIDGVPFFLANSFNVLGILIVMFALNWKLGLMVLAPTPIIILVSRKLLSKIWSLLSRRFRRRRFLNSLVNDALTGVRVVKAFGKEAEEIQRFRPANFGVFSANMRFIRFENTVFPFLFFVMRLGGLIVWAFGGWAVVQGTVSFGLLMSFVGYIALIYQPLQFMTMIADWGSNAMNAAQRIFEIIDSVSDVRERENPVHLPNIRGKIDVRNVTFSYEPNKPVLHNVTFSISAGEMVGLVGHTGAGKSTITNLITRLYDVEEGEIAIDGVNVKDLSVSELRSQIGIVLQDTFLFNGTIAENISYAKPKSSRTEVVEAAKTANAHDFIIKLPDGYDTLLGKKGKDLSGGEKQRIAIARAILLSPRILVFDEATSSVDTQTEQKIQEAIGKMVEGRTTIAIAHRLSTLRRANRLVVLNEGKIEEMGTHDELIKKRGKYYEMVKKEREALRVIAVGDEG